MHYLNQKTINTIVLTFFFDLAQKEIESVTERQVFEGLNKRIGLRRIQFSLDELQQIDAVEKLNFYGESETHYSITSTGYTEAEALYLKPNSQVRAIIERGFDWYFDRRENVASNEDLVEVPASDRVVALDHNDPKYKEIKDGLDDAIEKALATKPNEISGDEHATLIAGLRSARELWNSFQLTKAQVEVGIIMAVEKAQEQLKLTFEAAKGSLLTEAIMALFLWISQN